MLRLLLPTPGRWLTQVQGNLEELLIDHAHCEKKAAGAALNLLFAYVERLDLCEAMTLIHTGHVPDDVWERARAAFPDGELAQLVFQITAINAWNRLMITSRTEPGHYQPRVREAA